jgi:hypothetical protein
MRAMIDVVIYGNTLRHAELRHELPPVARPDGLAPLSGRRSARVHAVAFLHAIAGFVFLSRIRPDRRCVAPS